MESRGGSGIKGILFKPWKRKAIAESNPDKEWQTRRMEWLERINYAPDLFRVHRELNTWSVENFMGLKFPFQPRYHADEVVYIKEAYREIDFCLLDIEKPFGRAKVEYRDGEQQWCHKPKDSPIIIPDKWRSPLFMPEWAARTFIQITDVRAERLQEITPEDCLAEGIVRQTDRGNNIFWYEICGEYHGDTQTVTPLQSYAILWDSISPKFPWSSNPWVWVYTVMKAKATGIPQKIVLGVVGK